MRNFRSTEADKREMVGLTHTQRMERAYRLGHFYSPPPVWRTLWDWLQGR